MIHAKIFRCPHACARHKFATITVHLHDISMKLCTRAMSIRSRKGIRRFMRSDTNGKSCSPNLATCGLPHCDEFLHSATSCFVIELENFSFQHSCFLAFLLSCPFGQLSATENPTRLALIRPNQLYRHQLILVVLAIK